MTDTTAEALRRQQAAYRAKQLRYKRSALSTMGWEFLQGNLSEIQWACDDISASYTPEEIVDAFDGDEERAWEFQLAFTSLSYKADQLNRAIEEFTDWDDDVGQKYDDCTVALLGNRYDVLGFDTMEEDYFSLCRYEQDLAETEAGKRIMRWTKKEMISNIGQAMGIHWAFYDLYNQYQSLQTELDILRGESQAILETIKAIESAYEEGLETDSWRKLDRLAATLPQKFWIE